MIVLTVSRARLERMHRYVKETLEPHLLAYDLLALAGLSWQRIDDLMLHRDGIYIQEDPPSCDGGSEPCLACRPQDTGAESRVLLRSGQHMTRSKLTYNRPLV